MIDGASSIVAHGPTQHRPSARLAGRPYRIPLELDHLAGLTVRVEHASGEYLLGRPSCSAQHQESSSRAMKKVTGGRHPFAACGVL